MGATLSCLAASEPGTLESRSDSAQGLQFSGQCKVRVRFQEGVGEHRFVCWRPISLLDGPYWAVASAGLLVRPGRRRIPA